eukprot:scaffold2986_cov406-Prasinococcus_capsulatus_cf.AAC.14
MATLVSSFAWPSGCICARGCGQTASVDWLQGRSTMCSIADSQVADYCTCLPSRSGYIHSKASMFIVLGGNLFLTGLQLYWGSLIIKGLVKKFLPKGLKPSLLVRGLIGKVCWDSRQQSVPC